MIDFKIHDDAKSKELVAALRKAIQPVLDVAAPSWSLHHIEVRPDKNQMLEDTLDIRLVIKPIWSIREVPDRTLMLRRKVNHD